MSELIEPAQHNKYLTFVLDDVSYGLSIGHVVEIIGIQPVTPVPHTPGFICGVINLRGQVIPVMDVRIRFGMSKRRYDERTCIIVSQVGDTRLGLVVDTVSEVLDIEPGQIEAIDQGEPAGVETCLAGIGNIEGQVKLLLDAQRLVSRQGWLGHG